MACVMFEIYLMDYTYWGKYCSAMGENKNAVKRSGIDTVSVSIIIHVIAAFMFFLGTIAIIFVTPYGSTNRNSNYLYQILAAASLGGATVSKRGFEIQGLVAGIISMVMLQQLFTIYSLNAFTLVVQGAIILTTFFVKYSYK